MKLHDVKRWPKRPHKLLLGKISLIHLRKHAIPALIISLIVLPVVVFQISYTVTRSSIRKSRGQEAASNQQGSRMLPETMLQGLERKDSGKCKGVYNVQVPEHARSRSLQEVCTPGPELVADFQATSTTPAPASGGVPCYGDGVSGKRVQAIYAVSGDKPDRYDAMLPYFRSWAGYVDSMLNTSAQKTGSQLHAKWVTTPDCQLDVAKVVMPATGDDSFGGTIAAVRDAGFDDSTRKYLIWTDASVYCGLGSIYLDDTHDPAKNLNNTGPMYSRIDKPCWGLAASGELHELSHMLGAVQLSAPNATGLNHCTEDHDIMCYNDGAGGQLRVVCPIGQEVLLDCRENDYLHGNPAAGSYLATHWNIFNSGFLYSDRSEDKIPPTPPANLTATVQGPSVLLSWDKSTDNFSSELTYKIYRQKVSTGSMQYYASASTNSFTDSYVEATTTYRYYVVALDELGNISNPGNEVQVTTSTEGIPPDSTPPAPPYDLVASSVTQNSFAVSWKLPDNGGDISKMVLELNGKPYATYTDDRTAQAICCSLTPGTTYSVRLRAYDTLLNEAVSPTISVKTLSPPPPPPPSNPPPPPPASVVPYDLKLEEVNGSYVRITAKIDATTASGALRYYVLTRVGTSGVLQHYFASKTTPATYTFTDRQVLPQYVSGYYISVRDSATNAEVGRSSTLPFTFSGAPETHAPQTPSGFTVRSATSTGATIEWAPTGDDSGVIYRYHRTVTGPNGYNKSLSGYINSHYASSLSAGSTYTLKVKAEDIWGNMSPEASFVFTTP